MAGRPRLYANATARKRAQRAREKAAREHQLDFASPAVAVVDHGDPVGVLASWAAETLVVPPGHPRAGQRWRSPRSLSRGWRRAGTRTKAPSARAQERKIGYRGDPRAGLFSGTAEASWMARRDCIPR